jgi:uncharacterized protein (TIGR01370 family)
MKMYGACLLWAAALLCGCSQTDDGSAAFAAAVRKQFTIVRPASLQPQPQPRIAAAATVKPTLAQVRSWVYALGSNTDTAGFPSLVAGSSYDMVVMGGGSYDSPLDRSTTDPSGTKLLIGYLDIGSAAAYQYPEFFVNGATPSWFGNQVIGFPGLYSVQYWNPLWEQAVFAKLDTIIARGYDGVLLDVLDANLNWSANNPLGNPVYANAVQAMEQLLADIRQHVNAKGLDHPFYLIGNNPTGVAMDNPAALKSLDGAENEWVYYTGTPTSGFTYQGTGTAAWIRQVLAPVYAEAGIVMFGNDYPHVTDASQVFPDLDFYSRLGWVPSVIEGLSPTSVFTSGPVLWSATPANPVVHGSTALKNFITGGRVASTTLVGGDHGDVFLGGPGHNRITGGARDDTIYAHPAAAALRNRLTLNISANDFGATTPSLVIKVNGQVAVDSTPISAAYGTNVQAFSIDTTPFGALQSVELDVSGTSYTNSSIYSNVMIEDISYDGTPVDLTSGAYSDGRSSGGYTYSNNGSVTFGAGSFTGATDQANTSSVIDGGGGRNTVVYRGAYAGYSIVPQPDGSWLVTGSATAEGPDLLTRVQHLSFADAETDLGAPPAISGARAFAYAAGNYPQLFAGAAITGSYAQFDYAYFPDTQNYVAVDKSGGVWVLGDFTNHAVTFVGMLANFVPAIQTWEDSVGLAPAPTVSVAANATTAFIGQPVTLTWSSQNAVSCSASGAWAGSLPTNGSQRATLAVSGASNFTITCTGGDGKGSSADAVVQATTPLTSMSSAFTANSLTISTSEGAPYGDCDFWTNNPNTCWNTMQFGYGPTKVMRLYICLSGEVSINSCTAQGTPTGPLSGAMLADMEARIGAFMGTGARLLIRFIYNFGPDGTLNGADVPAALISSHIDQIAPILLKHRDLVFALQAGFIGQWGEWHHSTTGNVTAAAEKIVLDKELSYFAGVFPILVRYPGALAQYEGNLTRPANIGLHDDGFASDPQPDPDTIPCRPELGYCLPQYTQQQLVAYKNEIAANSMFAAETWQVNAADQSCNALDDLAYATPLQSFTLSPYPTAIGQSLVTQGCATIFYNKVGTRIEIQQAILLGNLRPNGEIYAALTMVNAGYGRVVRARPATLVLTSGGAVVAQIPIPLGALDLRALAAAKPAAPKTFEFTVTLPASFAATGSVDAALLVSDPAPSLSGQAAYALPLNSVDLSGRAIFNPSTGYNALGSLTAG